jgi:hypothetical protein
LENEGQSFDRKIRPDQIRVRLSGADGAFRRCALKGVRYAMAEQTFLSLKLGDMGALVNGAGRRIVFGAPGLDQGLAAALANASKRLGEDGVTVLLDVGEDNCRVGYGECEGYSILVEGAVAVRACPGLRIGFLLVDDDGYVFAMPALMVEDVATRHTAPNAIRATPNQILRLIDATKPEFKPPTLMTSRPNGILRHHRSFRHQAGIIRGRVVRQVGNSRRLDQRSAWLLCRRSRSLR